MPVTDAQLSRLITSPDDLKAASLGKKIFFNGLRFHARSQPATLPDQIAKLRDYVAKNPDAGRAISSRRGPTRSCRLSPISRTR